MSDGAELDSIQPGRIGPAVRLRLEEREESLSPFAAKSTRGRGRTIPEDPSPLRTEYQRDRDRIVHAKAFRRLKHKTQVFIAPQGDHYVTRLTHTLEVSLIARTIARALDLNEDLTEAIALGHDLGHTPFGHVGEEALNALDPRGFLHAQQSLRTVELLEKDGKGLNLTWEVRRGIVSHSKPRGDFLAGATDHMTLEGQVVRISDAVAYLNHDVADGFRAGVMSPGDLPEIVTGTLGDRHSQRVDTMVTDIVDSSWRSAGAGATDSGPPPTISMGARVREAVYALREFMFERVYKPDDIGGDGTAARRIIELLYDHYLQHPDKVPPEYRLEGTEPDQTVSDYIAGMTDHFAIRAAEKIEPGSGGNFMSRLL